MSKKSMIARVDKETWLKARSIWSGISDSEISKYLFNTSLARIEWGLGDKKIKERANKLSKNKKGSLFDVIFWLAVLLAMAFTIFIGMLIVSNFNTAIQAADIPAVAKSTSATFTANLPGNFDNMYLVMIILMVMITFIMASMVLIHPIFLVFYIIALVGVTFLSGIVAEVYQEFAASSQIIGTANLFTYIPYIMAYLPYIVGVFGSILAIVMFKNWSNAR